MKAPVKPGIKGLSRAADGSLPTSQSETGRFMHGVYVMVSFIQEGYKRSFLLLIHTNKQARTVLQPGFDTEVHQPATGGRSCTRN